MKATSALDGGWAGYLRQIAKDETQDEAVRLSALVEFVKLFPPAMVRAAMRRQVDRVPVVAGCFNASNDDGDCACDFWVPVVEALITSERAERRSRQERPSRHDRRPPGVVGASGAEAVRSRPRTPEPPATEPGQFVVRSPARCAECQDQLLRGGIAGFNENDEIVCEGCWIPFGER